jgi:hypothetical protein
MSATSGGAVDLSDLNGLFKKQFAPSLVDLKPDHCIVQDLIEWVPSDKLNGEFYAVPTVLRSNQGVTYLGESGAVGTLKSPKAGVMKEAQIKGSEINVRGQISYKTLSQAASKGAQAFEKSSAWLVNDLQETATIRLEIATLYGQTGLGIVESATDLTGGVANIVITDATFAPGLWVNLEGATLDSFTGTTKNNGSGALTIQSVTTSSRTIKVSFSGTLATECAAGDVLYFEGANAGSSVFNEMCGLFAQASAVTGTLFAIDRAAYALMQGNVVSSVGQPTKAKFIDAAMKAVDKGAMGEMIVLVGTKCWSALNAENMALQRFDGSYSEEKAKSGSKEIIYSKVGGNLKIVCHPMIKNGDAIMFQKDDVYFVGSSKPTFEVPGFKEQFFRFVQDSNACELQNYSDVAVYLEKPARSVVMSGLTYA